MTKTLISTITSHWKLYNYILHYMRLDESTYMTKGRVLRTLGKKSPEIFLIFFPWETLHLDQQKVKENTRDQYSTCFLCKQSRNNRGNKINQTAIYNVSYTMFYHWANTFFPNIFPHWLTNYSHFSKDYSKFEIL